MCELCGCNEAKAVPKARAKNTPSVQMASTETRKDAEATRPSSETGSARPAGSKVDAVV
jgi:hypothetical protein